MAIMRVSQHSGREGGGKHNDRQFEIWDEEHHIHTERTGLNRYWRWDLESHPERTFDESERVFYAKRYGTAQEAKNARYIREGHPERCKTTDDLMRGKQTRPEEIIIQVGNKDTHVDNDLFVTLVNEYFVVLRDWNKSHGEHMQLISIAIHFDEATPHAHIRRTWDVIGKDGAVLGQNKALKDAGIPLPNPSKSEGRYNNRKMTLDAEFREKWLDICEFHGISVEREAIPSMRHKNKADYVYSQIRRDKERMEELEAEKYARFNELTELEQKIQEAKDELSQLGGEIEKAKDQIDQINREIVVQKIEREKIKRQVEEAQGKAPEPIKSPQITLKPQEVINPPIKSKSRKLRR